VVRPDYKDRLDTLAMEPLILTPQQSQAFLKNEIDKWRKVANAAGIKPE
jgi:tripartite-type tricarboxylate transporter receptor subunit TctC